MLDPHGDPIPRLDGTVPDISALSLADVPKGEEARIVRVSDQQSERLRYVAELGLVPGATVKVTERAPFEGPVTIRIGKKTHALDRKLTTTILVELS